MSCIAHQVPAVQPDASPKTAPANSPMSNTLPVSVAASTSSQVVAQNSYMVSCVVGQQQFNLCAYLYLWYNFRELT